MVVADSILAATRRRRSGRGRVRGAAGCNRRAQGDRRRADLAVIRRRQYRARSGVRRRRGGAKQRSPPPTSWSKQTFRNQRIVNCPDGAALRRRLLRSRRANSYTLISGNQGVHVPRGVLAESFGVPNEKIRFICPDVGGGFGLRNNLYPEQAAILWAAKRVGRPVKWTNDRSESFLTDYAGRDLVTTARLAFTRRRPHHRLSGRPHRHHRRADRDLRAAEQRLSRRHHRLRHPADAHALPLGGDQHGADRAVPRRGPARGDAGAGAADRPRRGAARHGSRQNPAART